MPSSLELLFDDLGEVRTSEKDARQYKLARLKTNGLRVLLIHDDEIGKGFHGEMVVEQGKNSDGDMEKAMGGSDDDDDDDADDGEDDDGSDGEDESEDDEDDENGNGGGSGTMLCEEKKAAAALSVGIGSFADPPEAQGLAHYLEHMLFMGSRLFSDENEYDKYISAHGGYNNAFTECEETVYYFNVGGKHLRGALERFSGFFIEPLCKHDCMAREVQAVDSEFQGVLQSDQCRLQQLLCASATKGHLYNRFMWGNRVSLVDEPEKNGVDVRKRLFELYERDYKAENMCLCIIGAESIPELMQYVVDIFSAVPKRDVGYIKQDYTTAGMPFDTSKPLLYTLPSVKHENKLTAYFVLPCLKDSNQQELYESEENERKKFYLAKADDYVSHLVGHEGPGSLLSSLKRANYATSLCAGVGLGGMERSSCCSLFSITISLTSKGMENVDDVCSLMFAYLQLLQRQEPEQWIYDELKQLSTIKLKFIEEEEPEEYCCSLAMNMHQYNNSHVVVGDFLYQCWNPELIKEVLDCMTPEKVILFLQQKGEGVTKNDDEQDDDGTQEMKNAPSNRESTSNTNNSKDYNLEESWFKFPYNVEQISQEKLLKWTNAYDDIIVKASNAAGLAMPPKNEYVPTVFDIKSSSGNGSAPAAVLNEPSVQSAPREIPKIVYEDSGLKLWHKVDDTFRTPRAVLALSVTTTTTFRCAKDVALASLSIRLLHESLQEELYLADVAGLQSSVSLMNHRIELKMSGFDEKMTTLLGTILRRAMSLTVDSKKANQFFLVKDALIRQMRNRLLKPMSQAQYARWFVTKEVMVHIDDVLESVIAIDCDEVGQYLPDMLKKIYIEAFAHGNLVDSDVQIVINTIKSTLQENNCSSIDKSDRFVERCLLLQPSKQLTVVEPVKNVEEENSVIEVFYQICYQDLSNRVMLSLFEQCIYEQCFNNLRTKQQLGYSVDCGLRLTHGVLGFSFRIMSSSHSPVYLEERITSFLSDFIRDLPKMDKSEFQKQKEALIASKLTKPNNLNEEAMEYWDTILDGTYEFRQRQAEAELISQIELKDLVVFATKYFCSTDIKRLNIQIFGKSHVQSMPDSPSDEIMFMSDKSKILEFKSTLETAIAPSKAED